MSSPVIKNSHGFSPGMTPILSSHEDPVVGLDFGILRLQVNEHFDLHHAKECAVLLLSGDVEFSYGNVKVAASRESIFDEAPIALHLAARQSAKISACKESELAILSTANDASFEPMIFDKNNMLEHEHRGKDLLNDTAYRMVRTIFDKRNRPQANLVLGEVIAFPGRWSSYPPHYHAQPEIYHYRFTEPCGYGHAELGDDVYKMHHGDTIKIIERNTHAQVSAPGYGMYYLWAIRHLPHDPYQEPTFDPTHAWTREMSANARVWKPRFMENHEDHAP